MSQVNESSALVREREVIDFLQSLPASWTLQDALSRMPFWPQVTTAEAKDNETVAEAAFRVSVYTLYPIHLQEKKTVAAWETFLVDPQALTRRHAFRHAYRKWRRERERTKQSELSGQQVLRILRYLSPRASMWSTRRRRDLAGLVRKNHEVLQITTRYTLADWSRELFHDADAIEHVPTDKVNEVQISLVQFLLLITQILTKGLAGLHLRPSIPRRVITSFGTSYYALIPIPFDQERMLFHRDYIQSSKRWSRLLAGPKLLHERRMSLDSYLDELKQVHYALPLRWVVTEPPVDVSGILLLPRNTRFVQQLCINPASYITLEDWRTETHNLFLFYAPISGDWIKEQERRAHCLSKSDLRSALTAAATELDKQVLLWNQHEPNPAVRFYRLPGAEVWIDDASAQLLLKDANSPAPGLAAYFLIPVGKSQVGTMDALRGVHSSFHGTDQTIYGVVPFLRSWGALKQWPMIFTWLVRFAANLFSVEALNEFFSTIFVNMRSVGFQPFVNRLHTDLTVDSVFHPFEIVMFALTDRGRPPWTGEPSAIDLKASIHNLASHYNAWKAAQNLSLGLRQAYGQISAMGQTLSDAEVKLSKSADPMKPGADPERIRHHWTGFSKQVEPTLDLLIHNKQLTPLLPRKAGMEYTLRERVMQSLPMRERVMQSLPMQERVMQSPPTRERVMQSSPMRERVIQSPSLPKR